MILTVQRTTLVTVPIKAALWLTLLTSASGFTLFLDGGARAQGMSNAVERTGLLKFVDFAFVPLAALLPIYILIFVNRALSLRSIVYGTGFRLAALAAVMACLQRLNGTGFSNAMIGALVAFVAISAVASLVPSVLSKDEIFSSLNSLYFIGLALSLYLIKFVPDYGISVNAEGTWQGMFSHKNNLGIFCATYAMVLPGYWRTSRLLTLVNFALAALLVYGSKSYTAIGAFVLAALIAAAPARIRTALLSTKRTPIMAALLLSATVVVLSIDNFSLAFLDKDFTFSGRSYIWAFSLAGYSAHPVLGQGMNALLTQVGRNSSAFFNATGQLLTSHHNGFIAALYDFGAVGAAGFAWIANNALGRFKTGGHLLHLALCCFIPAIVLNTFEERLLSPNVVYFMAVLLVAINESPLGAQSQARAERSYI